MIKLNFDEIVSFYVFFFIVTLLGSWIFSVFFKKEENNRHELPLHLIYCSICTFVYPSSSLNGMTLCPRCGSYNEKSKEDHRNIAD
ncbi:MAG: hypothetical protein KKB82_07700 [Candidatus Omnitrophica bacterium]|nr:hypothetical protein [Candidatus Omnitrophota bacterium]MBU1925786.1 hypothetical protein [Candidatus Omnitrophota bacterium]